MKRYNNECVLFFSDTHFPYHNKHTLEFLADLKSTFNPDRIICGGDLLDLYSISAYPTDVKHPDTWTDEIKKARKLIRKLGDIFPTMEVMESNHDDRAYKKARIAGIPREMMIPYKKVIGAPDGWTWHRDLTLTVDSTRRHMHFAHTKSGGVLASAKDLGMTTVLGHQHTKFTVTCFKPLKNKPIWAVDGGCLVSDKGAPYAYNKTYRGRPVNGAVLLESGVPRLLPL